MVAVLRSERHSERPSEGLAGSAVPTRNLVRRTERADLRVVEARRAERQRVALRAWLCGADGSQRGWILDLSTSGARLGGVGTRLKPGERVLCKVVLAETEAPAVLRAEVVRYAPVAAADRWACPELCVRFLDDGPEHERVEDYVRALGRRARRR